MTTEHKTSTTHLHPYKDNFDWTLVRTERDHKVVRDSDGFYSLLEQWHWESDSSLSELAQYWESQVRYAEGQLHRTMTLLEKQGRTTLGPFKTDRQATVEARQHLDRE